LQGYVYSVFNLVYESNIASCRLWDSLGFDRIGRVPGCGQLKGHEKLVDAIQYGRHLVSEEELQEIVKEQGLKRLKAVMLTDDAQEPSVDATVSGVSASTEVSTGALL
jgi:hypothetical protein